MEKKTEDLLNAINPLKKKVAAKKPAQDKDSEARAKVDELLKGTSVGKPTIEQKPQFDVKEIKEEKTSKWLEDQVDLLNKQVEELENEILYYKDEMQKMQNSGVGNGGVVNSGILSPDVVALFRHFENVYEQRIGGDEPMIMVAHPQSGHGILDKFIEYIPQLNGIKRYRYRGSRMY
jgi:hypothetical protein